MQETKKCYKKNVKILFTEYGIWREKKERQILAYYVLNFFLSKFQLFIQMFNIGKREF